MKRIFFSLLVLAYGFKSNSQSTVSNYEKWKLNERVAKRMIKRAGNKGCGFMKPCQSSTTTIKNPNTEVYDWLKNNYTTVEPVQARYITFNNKHYGSLRNLSGDTAKIKGYLTTIYRVSGSKNKMSPATTSQYYDIVTIHPPPEDTSSSDQ